MSIEQYNSVCKEQFEGIRESIQSIDNRLFHDNGTKSVQTRINELATWQANQDAEKNKDKSVADKAVDFGLKHWALVLVVVMLLWNHFSVRPFTTDEIIKAQEQVSAMTKQVQTITTQVQDITNIIEDANKH